MSTKNVKSGQQGADQPPRREQREDRYEAPPAAPPSGIRRVDRLTEDDMAQAALGGPKGSPELPPAPLTKTEREQNSPNDDPGHVA